MLNYITPELLVKVEVRLTQSSDLTEMYYSASDGLSQCLNYSSLNLLRSVAFHFANTVVSVLDVTVPVEPPSVEKVCILHILLRPAIS